MLLNTDISTEQTRPKSQRQKRLASARAERRKRLSAILEYLDTVTSVQRIRETLRRQLSRFVPLETDDDVIRAWALLASRVYGGRRAAFYWTWYSLSNPGPLPRRIRAHPGLLNYRGFPRPVDDAGLTCSPSLPFWTSSTRGSDNFRHSSRRCGSGGSGGRAMPRSSALPGTLAPSPQTAGCS